jgi:hypothetical protein
VRQPYIPARGTTVSLGATRASIRGAGGAYRGGCRKYPWGYILGMVNEDVDRTVATLEGVAMTEVTIKVLDLDDCG